MGNLLFGKENKKENKPKKVATGEKTPKRSFLSRFDLLNRFRHWFLGGVSLTRSLFRVHAAWQAIGIIVAILTVMYIMAAFYTESGEFVINIDKTLAHDGFYISNTTDFDEKLISLRGKAVVNADNISIFDISSDVLEVDGEHNGENYVAHTFYVKNETGKTIDYRYTLNIRAEHKNADEAVWILVSKNDKHQIFAMEGANGEAEVQYSIYEFPFCEYAEFEEKQYQKATPEEAGVDEDELLDLSTFEKLDKVNKLTTTPFASEKVVTTGLREGIKNGEYDKYTVVIWYEGEDPECTDDIIGGWVECYMDFTY